MPGQLGLGRKANIDVSNQGIICIPSAFNNAASHSVDISPAVSTRETLDLGLALVISLSTALRIMMIGYVKRLPRQFSAVPAAGGKTRNVRRNTLYNIFDTHTYSAVQINVVKSCVSAILINATFDHMYLDNREAVSTEMNQSHFEVHLLLPR